MNIFNTPDDDSLIETINDVLESSKHRPSQKQRDSQRIASLSNMAHVIRSTIQHHEDLVKKGKEAEKKLKGLYADLKKTEAELKSIGNR